MKFWTAVSAAISCVVILDVLAWFVTGTGLGALVSDGPSSPFVLAVTDRITGMSDWEFLLAVAGFVVVVSLIISLCFVSTFHNEKMKTLAKQFKKGGRS